MAEWIEELTWIPKLSGWSFVRPIKITEQSGNNLSDYQVLIELNSSNFDFSKAKSDGSDIRFLLPSGKSIPYWIESWDKSGQSAKVWVKVPSIPANSSTVIYMYYGNPSATDESNGDAVFEFFDDFEGTSLDTSKWDEIDPQNCLTPRVENDYLHMDITCSGVQDNSFVSSKNTVTKPSGLGLRMYLKSLKLGEKTSNIWTVASVRFSSIQGGWSGAEITGFQKRPNEALWSIYTRTSDTNYESSKWDESSYFPNNYILEFYNQIKLYRSGSLIATLSTVPSGNNFYVEIQQQVYNQGTDKTYLDTIWVTKYTDPEPTYTVYPEIWL